MKKIQLLLQARLSIQITTQDGHITYYQVIGPLLVVRAKQKQRTIRFLGKEFLQLGKRKSDTSRVSLRKCLKLFSIRSSASKNCIYQKRSRVSIPTLSRKNLPHLLPAAAAAKRLIRTPCPASSFISGRSEKTPHGAIPVWVNCIHKSYFSTELCLQVPERQKTDGEHTSRGLPLKLERTALHYLTLTSVNILNSCMVFH